MGWNQPIVMPQQPTFWDRLMPTLLSFGAQAGLMKMGQSWQAGQAEAAAGRALEAKEKDFQIKQFEKDFTRAPDWMTSGPEPIAKDMGFTQVGPYGGHYKPSVPKITPLMYEGKPLKNQFLLTSRGEERVINVTPGHTGPFVAQEGNQYGLPVGASFTVDKDNKPFVYFTPEKTLKRLGAEAKVKAEGGRKSLTRLTQEAEISAKAKAKFPPSAPKTTYRTLGSNIYKIEDGESTLIQKGSREERAVTNAMHDPDWIFADEVMQSELIEKHKRFLTGKTKFSKGYGTSEHPEGTTATNAEGIKIITKDGKWVKQ